MYHQVHLTALAVCLVLLPACSEKRPKEQERKARRIAVQATPGAASQHLGVEGGSVGKTGAAATGGTAGEGTQPEKASVPVTGGTQ
jgi:hypothetical protein